MHNTQIGIFKIAQTRVNWPDVFDWLEFIGVKTPKEVIQQVASPSLEKMWEGVPREGSNRFPATDASALISLAGKRCYQSFEVGQNPNVSKIRTDHAEYVTNILKSGHGSVLEHASWTFAIENVSRVFTGEMNRHRAGTAISEGSMRYIRFDDIGFTMPSSLTLGFGKPDWDKKEKTQHVLKQAFSAAEKFYLDLSNIWGIENMKDFGEKKRLTSMFRRLIGMGVSTGGVWTMNARAMRFILEKRASIHAEEEIFDVFDRIAAIMIADEPLLFGDFEKDEEGSWVPKYSKV